MKKTKKLRTRKHAVVLNRSAGGDAGITILCNAHSLSLIYYHIVLLKSI